MAGDRAASMWWLRQRARHRGYGAETDISSDSDSSSRSRSSPPLRRLTHWRVAKGRIIHGAALDPDRAGTCISDGHFISFKIASLAASAGRCLGLCFRPPQQENPSRSLQQPKQHDSEIEPRLRIVGTQGSGRLTGDEQRRDRNSRHQQQDADRDHEPARHDEAIARIGALDEPTAGERNRIADWHEIKKNKKHFPRAGIYAERIAPGGTPHKQWG